MILLKPNTGSRQEHVESIMHSTHLWTSWVPIIPVTVGLILPYLSTYLDIFLPEILLSYPQWAGIPVFLGGFLLAFSSVQLIYSQEQWDKAPSPAGTPKRLVISGPYRYVRNPMLLGMLLIICGEGLYFRSVGILSYLTAFFLFVNFVMVPGEERRLVEHFGGQYLQYKSKIRRWLPTTAPYKNDR